MAYTPPPYNQVAFELYDGVQSPPLNQVDLIIDQVFGNFGNYIVGQVTVNGQAAVVDLVLGHFITPSAAVQATSTVELPTRTGDGHFAPPQVVSSALANALLLKLHNSVNPCFDQYDFNLDSHTSALSWATTTALPIMPYSEYRIAITKNKLYAIGGRDYGLVGGVKELVYSVPINSSGEISGSWTLEPNALPEKKSACHIFQTVNHIHAIGGIRYDNGGYKPTKTCCSASIDASGNIGAWSSDPGLPFHLSTSMPVVAMGRAYLLGGTIQNDDGSVNEVTDKIFTAVVNQDGTIGQWSVSGSTLPFATTSATSICVATHNKVFLFNRSSSTITARYAEIDNDGSIGSWQISTSASFASGYGPACSVVTGTKIYIFDGREKVYSSLIDDSGFPVGFSLESTLSGFNLIEHAFVTSSRIYAFSADYRYTALFTGGYNDYLDKTYEGYYDIIEPAICDGYFANIQVTCDGFSTFPYYGAGDIHPLVYEVAAGSEFGLPSRYDMVNHSPWTLQYQFNRSKATAITGWATGPALPGTLAYSAAVVLGGKVTMLGGVADGYLSSAVTTATILANGWLDSWEVSPSPLPSGRHAAGAALTRDRVYLIGGSVNGTTSTATCITAQVSLGGEIGAWVGAPSLPDAGTMNAAVIVTINRIYVIGGTTQTAPTTTVYTAPIDSDGVIGQWSTHQYPLPVALKDSAIFKTDRYVYLLGGIDSTDTAVSSICRAEFGESGELGEWAYFEYGLPIAMCECSAITTRNMVFALGTENRLVSAPINPDGSVGAWSAFLNLPAGTACHQLVVTHSSVHIIGGWNAATTYHAVFSGGYDDYLRLGSDPVWVQQVYGSGLFSSPLVEIRALFLSALDVRGSYKFPLIKSAAKSGTFYGQLFSVPMPAAGGSAIVTVLGRWSVLAPRVILEGNTGADGGAILPPAGFSGVASVDIISTGRFKVRVVSAKALANMNPEDNPVRGSGAVRTPALMIRGLALAMPVVGGDFRLNVPSVNGIALSPTTSSGYFWSPVFRIFGKSVSVVQDNTLAFLYDETIAVSSGQPDEFVAFEFAYDAAMPPVYPAGDTDDPILKFER